MTVSEALRRGSETLAAAGIDSPRLDCEWLLAHCLRAPRLHLMLDPSRVLADAERAAFERTLAQRAQRRPLQHILGSVSFCGLEIAVSPAVLIPRPETEMLAELAWNFLNERAQKISQPPTALDFGTGSGCLAITLAVKCPHALVHAVDISSAALAVARANAARHSVAARIFFHESDGFAALPHDLRFDLIVANPPYIPSAEIATLQPEVRDHDPRLALDGGADGLDFYRRLARETPAWMRPGARLMMEFGDGQAEALRAIFSAGPWRVESVVADLSGRLRILVAAVAAA
jgi:release factor glutamine methyltransferase